jgi:hypothetical protein
MASLARYRSPSTASICGVMTNKHSAPHFKDVWLHGLACILGKKDLSGLECGVVEMTDEGECKSSLTATCRAGSSTKGPQKRNTPANTVYVRLSCVGEVKVDNILHFLEVDATGHTVVLVSVEPRL